MILIALALSAQAEPPEVIVVGQRQEDEKRLVDPNPQTGLPAETIRARNNRRLADLVRRLPGVLSGGPTGEDKEVRLRGLDKEFTRTQIDGVILPDGGEKREFQLNRLPSSLVEEVRVLRNRSAEFESDGIAGLLDVRLRPIPKEPQAEGRLGFGGVDGLGGELLQAATAFGWRPSAGTGLLGAFDHLDHTFLRSRAKSFSTGKLEDEDEEERQVSDDLFLDLGFFREPEAGEDPASIGEMLGFLRPLSVFTGPGELHVRPMILNLDKDKTKTKTVTEPGKPGTREEEEEIFLQRTWGISADHLLPLRSGLTWLLKGGVFLTEEDKDKDKTASKEGAGGVYAFEKQTLEAELKTDRAWFLRNVLTLPLQAGFLQELKGGVDLRWRRRDRDKEVREIAKNGAVADPAKPKDDYLLHERYLAVFLQDQVWIADDLSVLPGLRVENQRLESGGEAATTRDLNPSLHVLWQAVDVLSFHAAASRGVNRPKFDELAPYVQEEAARWLQGNPDLDPARSWNFDLGADLVVRHALLGVNVFHREIHGLLEEVDTGEDLGGKDVYRVENVGDGWTRGLELEERLSLGFTGLDVLGGVLLWSNQTYLTSEVETADGERRRFKDQPRLIVNAGVDLGIAATGTTFSIAWNWVADRVDPKPNGDARTIERGGTLDLALRQSLGGRYRVFLEVDNLLRKSRVETEDLANGQSTRKEEQGGRAALLGLEWGF